MSSNFVLVFLLLVALVVPAVSFVAVVIAVIRWLNRH